MFEQLIDVLRYFVTAVNNLAHVLSTAKVDTGKPQSAATTTKPKEDDLGLDDDMGLGAAAPAEKPMTQAEMFVIAKEAVSTNGRDFVRAALKKVKADQIKEVKPEDFKKFVNLLRA